MNEKPTFCPRCRKMHTGICPLVAEDRKRALTAAGDLQRPEVRQAIRESGEAKEIVREALKATIAEIEKPDAGRFDKKAYQREYMRRLRAEKAKSK